MPLVIAGFGDNIKVPGFFGETLYGQSAIKLGSITRKLLICGLKHTTLGSITTNAQVVAISSKEDADTYLGAGGECARMAYAALDEANSRKYGDMLEKLSKHSQLVVVTHNRETMSRAGILYGVTIGADGASKLLSVKLDEATAIAK